MTSTVHKQHTHLPTSNTKSKRPILEDPSVYTPLVHIFCTNLLVAGVIKQIPDPMAPTQNTFQVNMSKKLIIHIEIDTKAITCDNYVKTC